MPEKPRLSTYELTRLPSEFAVVLLTFGLVILVSPYLAGSDLGIFKVPEFDANTKQLLKVVGPSAFAFLLLLFIPIWRARTEVRPGTKQIKYVTDRISGNELSFTIVTPPEADAVTITDIKVATANISSATAAIHERFNLSDVQIPSNKLDLSSGKSVFYRDKVIKLSKGPDSASFMVGLYADLSIIGLAFRLWVVLLDTEGNKIEVPSDKIYVGNKEFGMPALKEVQAIDPFDVIGRLNAGKLIDCEILTLLDEDDTKDIFQILVSYFSSLCSEEKADYSLINAIIHFTTNADRQSKIFEIVDNMDDVRDFGGKSRLLGQLFLKFPDQTKSRIMRFLEATKELLRVPGFAAAVERSDLRRLLREYEAN